MPNCETFIHTNLFLEPDFTHPEVLSEIYRMAISMHSSKTGFNMSGPLFKISRPYTDVHLEMQLDSTRAPFPLHTWFPQLNIELRLYSFLDAWGLLDNPCTRKKSAILLRDHMTQMLADIDLSEDRITKVCAIEDSELLDATQHSLCLWLLKPGLEALRARGFPQKNVRWLVFPPPQEIGQRYEGDWEDGGQSFIGLIYRAYSRRNFAWRGPGFAVERDTVKRDPCACSDHVEWVKDRTQKY
ncbi:hypothetical protein B0J11DRAFT_613361, partial [Dendryphion nanum]